VLPILICQEVIGVEYRQFVQFGLVWFGFGWFFVAKFLALQTLSPSFFLFGGLMMRLQ
jgi:hypothetical protein